MHIKMNFSWVWIGKHWLRGQCNLWSDQRLQGNLFYKPAISSLHCFNLLVKDPSSWGLHLWDQPSLVPWFFIHAEKEVADFIARTVKLVLTCLRRLEVASYSLSVVVSEVYGGIKVFYYVDQIRTVRVLGCFIQRADLTTGSRCDVIVNLAK